MRLYEAVSPVETPLMASLQKEIAGQARNAGKKHTNFFHTISIFSYLLNLFFNFSATNSFTKKLTSSP